MNKDSFANILAVAGIVAMGIVGIVYDPADAKVIGLAAITGLVGFLGGYATAKANP